MRGTAFFCLLLSLAGLLGMAAPPGRMREAADKADGSEAEDAAVIADLDRWEEMAVAERYEFLQSLEMLRDAPPEQPAGTPGEAR